MMNFQKYAIIAFGWLAVLYPVWVRMQNMVWTPDTIIVNLFPFFGLIAFSLLWLHALSGVFEPWLRKHINFDRFVHYTAMIILVCMLAHPLLLFVNMKFNINGILSIFNNFYIKLGGIGLLLLLTYDIGKVLKKRYQFFERQWQNILTISTIGFLLIFFHALGIGSDVQSGPMRAVFIFYGVTAILATIYTYGIKRFFLRV